MGNKSSIEWTESTWNPVSGCTKISPGCQHCYAEQLPRSHSGSFAESILPSERDVVYVVVPA